MVQLQLIHEERSDNKAIIFTDITLWADLTTAQVAGPDLVLTITAYGGITYTIPNTLLVDALAAATTVGTESDIKYIITADLIGGSIGGVIPDDVYTITYTHPSNDDYLKNILVYGVAKQAVWQDLSKTDDVYKEAQSFSFEIEKALTNYAFLLDLESSTYCAEIEELKRLLTLLNNMI
jgi:hypothetical protein